MTLASAIIAASQWSAVSHMNPHLELATPTLLGARFMSDAEIEPIKEFWLKEYRGKCEVSKGLWKRFPLGTSKYHYSYSTSHDEVITGVMQDEGKKGVIFKHHAFMVRHNYHHYGPIVDKNRIGMNIDKSCIAHIEGLL